MTEPCKCIDCFGDQPHHDGDCEYMNENFGESPAEKRWGAISESPDPAEYAAWLVLCDLRGRSGIGNAIEECDGDIQIEIIDTIVGIIRKEMSA